jgi:hypothetical protein
MPNYCKSVRALRDKLHERKISLKCLGNKMKIYRYLYHLQKDYIRLLKNETGIFIDDENTLCRQIMEAEEELRIIIDGRK